MSVKEPIRTQQDPNLTGSNPAILLSLNDIFNERMRKAQLEQTSMRSSFFVERVVHVLPQDAQVTLAS